MGFIYKITNQINQKSYIGKTTRTIKIRWKEHQKNIPNLQHLALYRALYKYGISNFFIEEVEECDNNLLDEREIYWINYYNTYKKGYNCTEGGEGGIKTYSEDIDIIIDRYQNGEGLSLLCQEFGHDYQSLKNRLIEKGIEINSNRGPEKLSKCIAALDPNTHHVIAVYDSISAAARAICPEGHNYKAIINHICKNKNKNNISHNYLWKTVTKEEKEHLREQL